MTRSLLFALTITLTSTLAAESTIRLGNDVEPLSQAVSLQVDPRSERYVGTVAVDLIARKPVSAIRFHAEGQDIQSIAIDGAPATYERGEQAVITVTTGKTLPAGRHRLTITFTNEYNRQAVGLYKVVKNGEPYLYTQFQAIDARKAFPSWDEPTFKPSWDITIQTPSQYDVVSNGPLISEQSAGGWKTLRFGRTGALPAYLIALAVGKFEFTPVEGTSIPTRVVTVRGQGRLARLATKIIPPVLAELEKYFGTRYPFDKLDFIAVPDYWPGAMENAGAITFKDNLILVDENRATPSQRRLIAQYSAHELAHMWFGDLVTMEWWDDFWLNESFADWMGDKITERLYPQLGHQASEIGAIQRAMNNDARASANPVRVPDTTPDDAMRNVGTAYYKGKAVLAMFERWIGEDKFRQGVLDHLKANAWDNADANDFWRALARHAPRGSDAALASFIEIPGIPMIEFSLAGTRLHVTQRREWGAGAASGAVTPLWKIPLTIRYSDGSRVRSKNLLLDQRTETVRLEGSRVAWIFPQPEAAGYFRWRTPAPMMAALNADAQRVLTPRERLMFLGNTSALLTSGGITADQYLDVVARFANDPDPQVVEAALAEVERAFLTFDSPETRSALNAFVRRTLAPSLERLGLTRREGEPETATILRPQLMEWLGLAGDATVMAFARSEAARALANPAAVDSTILTTVLRLNAIEGDNAVFDEYRRRFETADNPGDRQRFFSAMSYFRRPEVRERALAYSLTGPLQPNEVLSIAKGADETAESRARSLRWAMENYSEITRRLPAVELPSLAPLAGGCEPELIATARQFWSDPARQVEGMERQLRRVSESVAQCDAVRRREMAAATRYLTGSSGTH
jgi:cytosol alanyl aminopeptidase